MSAASSAISPPPSSGDAHPPAGVSAAGPGRTRRVVHLCALAVGVGLIVWLLQRIGWTYIASCVSRLGAGGLAVVALLAACESICDALSLRAATVDRISRKRAVLVNQAGALVNQFLPGEVGEVWKATLLRRHAGESGVPAALIWNYAFKLTRPIAALVIAAVAWFWGEPDRHAFATLALGAAALSFLPYIGLRLLMRHGLATLATGTLTRVPILRRRVGPGVVERAQEIDHVVRSFAWRETKMYARVIAWQLAARGCSFFCGFAALWLLAGFSLPLVALIYAAANALNYLLLLLPTRLGAMEGSAYLLFHLLGLDAGLGLVYAVLTRVVRLAGASPGLLSFAVHRGSPPP